MSDAAICARGLSKRFGHSVALDRVDLDLPGGSTLAVLGPNGAGKSTLLRLMAGLTRPSRGSLEIGGRRAHGRAARQRVGFIGHATFLYPALTARENLIFAGRLHGVDDPAARADRLLADEGLERVADRSVDGFSRGMAQRVAIARGIVHDPDVVLLDEPFTGLDRRAAERLAERLGRLRAEGRTVVIVSHETAVVAPLVDAAIVLARGRVTHRSVGERPGAAELESAYLAAVDGPT